MRLLINQYVRICAGTLPCAEPVVEFGSFQVPGQDDISDLRIFFPDKKYIGADMRQGPGVDRVLNLHQIDLPDKPAGVLILGSVMNFPIHDYPHDYWRFTPEAFRSLLKPFSHTVVVAAGESLFPHTIVGVGFKGPVDGLDLSGFRREMEAWERHWTAAARPKGFKRFLKYLDRLDDKIRKALGAV